MNKLERLQKIETAHREKTRYRLTLAGGTTIILKDFGDVLRRCFQTPDAPRVVLFEPLHQGPPNILEKLINALLEDLPQHTANNTP